ncbi:MAG TPA: hypothetical protein VGR57_17840 [Ktedonobacterales bacterium]|nr:hypothetical protein [Ktedonobacterales bacterium]
MTEQQFTATATDIAQSWREAYQTIFERSVAAQERGVALARSVVERGIAELRIQSEAAEELLQALSSQAGEPATSREACQIAASSAAAAQARGIKLAQTLVESGIDELKWHGATAQDALETLARQSQQQVNVLQSLARASVESYANLAFAPFFRGVASDN